jgi:hypothetical protein
LGAAEVAPTVAAWTARYEAIRRQVLQQSGHGDGLALLLRCGLLIWLKTEPVEATERAAEPAPDQEASETPELPGGLSQEVTRILVNMLLDPAKEDPP